MLQMSSCFSNTDMFFYVSASAELWTRVRTFLKPGPDVVHYILTHFRLLWEIINHTFLREFLMRLVLTGADLTIHSKRFIQDCHIFNTSGNVLFLLTVRSNLIPSPPTYNSNYGYLSWEAYYNLSYYTRILPPVPKDCPSPLGVKG